MTLKRVPDNESLFRRNRSVDAANWKRFFRLKSCKLDLSHHIFAEALGKPVVILLRR